MENPKPSKQEEEDTFFDAFDEFPFYECSQSNTSTSSLQSTISDAPNDQSIGGIRRRRSSSSSRVRKIESLHNLSENVEKNEQDLPLMRVNNDENFSLLFYITEFIVKAIGFQFNLLISLFSFPFRVLYYCCMFVVNPFRVVKLGRDCLVAGFSRLWNLVSNAVGPYVSRWFNEHKFVLNLALRYGLGLFWSVYVCVILVTLLISSFVISGLVMRYYLVERPFHLKDGLNFDYTETRPAAFVPVSVCPSVGYVEKNEVRGVRVIPPNHKLQATVTLVLPESEYNRNLGIFQIRVDFLSESGKSLASLSHISMLVFKSEPIRLLLTFLKVIPLVSGYTSESQIMNLKFKGYSEGAIPTACIKVTIEQRAEFRPGAGIPEIYDAFLHLESELPFLKRCVWQWRKTIFIWFSMMLFMVELLLALICCRPVILPRARTRANVDTTSGPQTSSHLHNTS